MENLVDRVLDHSARITALEEWQRRQNGHLSEIERKVTDLQGTVLGLGNQIVGLHGKLNGVLLSVIVALIALIADLVLTFVRG